MNYVTAEEKTRLEEQLKDLHSRRKVITERIATARALGDLKENGDYHAAREEQGLNEAKIRQLEQRLAGAVVTSGNDAPVDVVFIGATVQLRNTTTEVVEVFRLVGEATGELSDDVIEVTLNSPMGMALLKARVGEKVRVESRRGEKHYEIIAIM